MDVMRSRNLSTGYEYEYEYEYNNPTKYLHVTEFTVKCLCGCGATQMFLENLDITVTYAFDPPHFELGFPETTERQIRLMVHYKSDRGFSLFGRDCGSETVFAFPVVIPCISRLGFRTAADRDGNHFAVAQARA